jgi:hypothetical protein
VLLMEWFIAQFNAAPAPEIRSEQQCASALTKVSLSLEASPLPRVRPTPLGHRLWRVSERRQIQVYRDSFSQRWLYACYGLTVVAVIATILNLAWVGGAIAFLLLSWRSWRSGMAVRHDGVEVRTLIGMTRFVPWADIDHFELRPYSGKKSLFGTLVRRDGESFSTFSINVTKRNTARADRVLAELNSVVAQHQQS